VPPPPGAHLPLDFSSASCALVGNLALETFAMSENSEWEACSNNSPGKEARPDQASAAEEAFQEPPEQQSD
jgi:hypothetical protein